MGWAFTDAALPTPMPADPAAVRHEPEHDRFTLATDHGDARVEYLRQDDVLALVHTEVPPPAEGQGIGSALVQGTLDLIREHGWTMRPQCPFVAAYVERHDEYADLVAG